MVLHLTAQRRGKLVSFLRRELGLSSSLVKRLKWRGAFLVNGETAHTDRVVEAGEEITVVLSEDAPDYPAEDGALDILYEDDAILALDKPAGILMHPSFHRNTGTLANFVAGYYARSGQACAVHPVSRLDRDTFGVVLLAKNAHVHGLLMDAQRRGDLRKTYQALTWGCPDPPEGIWDAPLGRVPGESLLRRVDPAGKIARTEYRVLETQGGLARPHPSAACSLRPCRLPHPRRRPIWKFPGNGLRIFRPAAAGKGAFPAPSPHRRGCDADEPAVPAAPS